MLSRDFTCTFSTFTSSSLRQGNRKHPIGTLVRTTFEWPTEDQSDFISLELSLKQPSATEIDVTDESQSYRSILGPSKSEEATTEKHNGDKLTRVAIEEKILDRNAELSRQTERDLENVTAWLHLAEHQERVILPARYNDRPFNYAETKLVAEAKLERAFKVNGENPQRDHLLLGETR
jgi:hypothetical protein